MARLLPIQFLLALACVPPSVAHAQVTPKWVTSWAASAQGPFPSGSIVAQPDQSFTIPNPASSLHDQSVRLVVRPTIWGPETRIRFTNVFGSRPLTIDGAFVGLQSAAASLVKGSNRPLTFGGRTSVTIAAGSALWSDPVRLAPVIARGGEGLDGRRLALSFHVAGESGPVTWHAKGMLTSYLSPPGAGSHGAEEGEAAFPYPINSWLFVDAVDMKTPTDTALVVALGDSITDGTNSTLNGDDRWPDQLQRRFNAAFPNRVAVVDEGIGSNQVTGPATYSIDQPFGGGPSALDRLQRDVVSLSGVKTVIWFEGINDLSRGVSPEDLIAGLRRGVAVLRAKIPGVRVIGATITPSLGAKGNAGTPEENVKRRQVNDFIRSGGLYDGIVDFEAAVIDPATGGLRPEFVFGTTIGGPGDKLHPNRAGYVAMAGVADLGVILPSLKGR